MEIFRCVLDWCQCRRIVVNSRVNQDGPVPGIGFRGRREVIYTTSLNVDGGNLGVVVFCQDSEFNGSAPCRWFQYCRDVIIPWSAVKIASAHAVCGVERHLYPRIASDHVTMSFRISSATTVDFQKQLRPTTIQLTFPNILGLSDVLLEHDSNGRKQTGVVIWYDLTVPLSNVTCWGWVRPYPVYQITPFSLDGIGFVCWRLGWG